MLLGQCNAFIIDQCRVLDRSHTCEDCILNTFASVGMGRDTQAEVAGFVYCRRQLLRSELQRFWIATVSEHGASREHLNVIGAIVSE